MQQYVPLTEQENSIVFNYFFLLMQCCVMSLLGPTDRAFIYQVNDLRKELESRTLSSKGLKSQLIARLTKQLKVEEQKEEQKELEKSEKEEEEEEDRKSEEDKEVRIWTYLILSPKCI